MRSNFRVIPVIDVMNGQAVHANKGKRKQYKPVSSKLVESASAIHLIRAYIDLFGFQEVYIADLDAIVHENPNIELIKTIINETEISLMLDAGVRNIFDIVEITDLGVDKVILATETIDSFDVIADGVEQLGPESVVVSIDMKNKVILARNEKIKGCNIFEIIEFCTKKGVKEFILLDLVRVGTRSGCYDPLYGEIRKKYPNIEMLLGGGAKNLSDIQMLRSKSVDGILIATALHEGKITPTMIKNL